MKTTLKFLVVMALVASTSAVSAADWWRWSSNRSSRSSVRNYRNNNTFLFPEQNTMILRQDVGSGISIYSSGPITQFGTDAPLYTPQQQPFRFGIPQNLNTGIPNWARR